MKYQCAQCPTEITWGRLCYACKMRNMRHTRARRAYLLMQRHTEPRPKRISDPVKVARDVQQTIPITESIARLDAQFPWLRGAERSHQ